MTCTFFGHRDTPWNTEKCLAELLREMIINDNADNFLIGNQGNFDRIALNVLKKLKKEFPNIKIAVVLAYMPGKKDFFEKYFCNTIYPQGLEKVPQRLAIIYRNRWMIDKADCVITYVCRKYGGAHKFMELSLKKKKQVINIYENI